MSNLCHTRDKGLSAGPLMSCNGHTDLWLERILKFIPVNENINNTMLDHVVCALPDAHLYVVTKGNHGLDSRHMTGQCLLGYHSISSEVLAKGKKSSQYLIALAETWQPSFYTLSTLH